MYKFHPRANIEKMSNGQPLNDADRWDWLIVLRRQALTTLASHAASDPPPPPAKHLHPDPDSVPKGAPGVVITCSALKAKYRDVIRVASYNSARVHVHFIYLQVTEEVSSKRVASRQNHYMKGNMVHSQFMDLEEPTEEEWDCITVDCTQSQAEVMESTLHQVKHAIQQVVSGIHSASN